MELNKINDVNKYFEKLLETIKNIPIIKVCSLASDCCNDDLKYSIDSALYIIFQNYYMLIIEYYEASRLNVEYRKITDFEKEKFAKVDCRDFFNRTDEVYNVNTMKMNRRINTQFEYDAIFKIDVNHTITDYTFNQITIHLKNGNEIYLCPEDAVLGGYLAIWCKGAKINIKKFETES